MSTTHLGTPSTLNCVTGKSGLRARDNDNSDIQNPHAWAERKLADTLARVKRATALEYARRSAELW